nr:uncharacterized protein LOC105866178 [Microcebus murinus]
MSTGPRCTRTIIRGGLVHLSPAWVPVTRGRSSGWRAAFAAVGTYSTGSGSDGRLAAAGCHDSVIMGIEGASGLHLQAAAAVTVRYPSSFQKALTLLGSWEGRVTGSVMRGSPKFTASGILPCKEEWFSNKSLSLYLSVCLMFKLTWRDVGRCSLAHLKPSSVGLPCGILESTQCDCDVGDHPPGDCWSEDFLPRLPAFGCQGELAREMASPRRPAAQLPVSDRPTRFSGYGRYGWLTGMFVNSGLPGRARMSLWAKTACATLAGSLGRKRGWSKLLTFSERRRWNCRISAASARWPPLPWSHTGKQGLYLLEWRLKAVC